jgi:hypothetical protein
MLIKIASVGQSANGKTNFANDLTGRVFFPKTKEMELVAGHYAYAVKVVQTKSYDEAGQLIDITPRDILQITATFASKAEAIEAAAEVNVLEAEVVASSMKAAKELGLTEAAVAQLAEVW